MPHKNMQLMLITAVPEVASFIEEHGVHRIFLDMETLGKEDRQKNLDLPNHTHSFSDVTQVKKALKQAEVMLRINPLHKSTKEEVNKAIEAGADCIMLPFFHHQNEVKEFLEIVHGRVKTNILLETASAAARAEQILSLPGLDEVHFGLNDLRISLKHDFLFESFAGGLIESLCQIAQKNKLSYGIGGVGRIGKEMLPAELIVKEHIRLGSQRVILSRVFHGNAKNLDELKDYVDFPKAIEDLRNVEAAAHDRSPETQETDRQLFCEKVLAVAEKIRNSQ